MQLATPVDNVPWINQCASLHNDLRSGLGICVNHTSPNPPTCVFLKIGCPKMACFLLASLKHHPKGGAKHHVWTPNKRQKPAGDLLDSIENADQGCATQMWGAGGGGGGRSQRTADEPRAQRGWMKVRDTPGQTRCDCLCIFYWIE